MPEQKQQCIETLYQAERDHWWYQSRRLIMEHLFWNKVQNKKLTVLSIGCSTGQELLHIRQFADVTGIDIDAQAVKACQKRGIKALHGDIQRYDFQGEKFDIIVAMDVLEHIEDDYGTLKKMYDLLKPQGKLLVTVPAFQFLWSQHDETGDFPHVRRYTFSSLKKLLNSQKLSINLLSYYNFFLFPVAFITKKIMNAPIDTQLKPLPYLLHTIFKTVFSCERFFLPYISFPWGVSLVALCQKK